MGALLLRRLLPRRRRTAPTFAAALLLALALCAPVAHGAITNVHPTDDEFGAPTDALFTNQNLWAYTTSDLTGGVVCIVPESTQYNGGSSLTCDTPAWGSTNQIGATIGSSWRIIETPYLRSGTWKLLGDSANDGVDSLSAEFTVFPCDPGACDTRIADEVAARYKAAAADMALRMNGMKGLTSVLTKVAPTEPFAQFKNALNGLVKGALSGQPLYIRTVADQLNKKLNFINQLPSGPNGMALSLLRQTSEGALAMYLDIVNDPPEDYATVAEPTFDVPGLSSGDAGIDATVLDHAQTTGYGAAMLTAYERYQAAVIDGNEPGVHRQAEAMGRFGGRMVEEMYATADGLDDFADAIAADPDFAEAKVVQEHVDALVEFVDRMNATGFTAEELDDLATMGLNQAQMDHLASMLKELDLAAIPVDQRFQDELRAAADDMRENVIAFDEMARWAAAVGQSTNSPPVAAFTASATSGPPPLEVTFADISTDADGDPLTVTWDFGDSATGEGATATHTYTTEGTFTVTQTVTDGASTVTSTRTITVEAPNQPPSASFTSSPSGGIAPLDVSFDATASTDSDGTIVAYDWDFGDGSTGTGATTSHSYPVAGTYTVTLTVTDDDGATATATEQVTVTGNQGPTAAFSPSATTGAAPLNVAFDASASSDPDGTITAYDWDFGDGATGTGASVSHTYETPGTYTATLTVTDDRGATDTESVQIAATSETNTAPAASFHPSRTAGRLPLTVDFDATASNDPDGSIVSYAWSFGDGDTATGATVQHTFTTACFCAVTLTVTDDDGATATAQVFVSASENVAPSAGFTASPESGAPPLAVSFASFASDSNGDPLTVTWDFGDGGTATGGTATHTYTEGGRYTVTQTVDDGLATASATREIVVTASPVASFTRTPSGGEAPVTVSFDAGGSSDADGSIASYAWEFGDGGFATGETPTHTYTRGGEFTVLLTVTDDLGQTGTTSATVNVTGPPILENDTMQTTGVQVVDVFANDMHPNDLGFALVSETDPEHGTATCDADGNCRYELTDAGHTGTDSFTYTVRDDDGREATATVQVLVSSPPEVAPALVARDDEARTRAQTAVTVAPLANDDGAPPLAISQHGAPQHGTVDCDADSCEYTPAAGFEGTDAFTYEMKDSSGSAASAAVRVVVAPADAGFPPAVDGRPAAAGDSAVQEGEDAVWSAGAAAAPEGVDGTSLGALDRPAVTAALTGRHSVKPGSVRTADGWTPPDTARAAEAPLTATAGPGALLGEAISEPIPRPLPPLGQGTGGDGHVPILVGSKVFAFFHHQNPTQITCADRITGSRCPGYPKTVPVGAGDIIGPAAIVGTRMYVHGFAAGSYKQRASISLFCWDAATDETCGLFTLDRVERTFNPGASAPVLVGGRIYVAADTGRLYCFDPSVDEPCATPSLPLAIPGGSSYDILDVGSRIYVSSHDGQISCVDVSAGADCDGWDQVQSFGSRWNLVRRHDADGAVDGICVADNDAVTCMPATDPASAQTFPGWPGDEQYYSVTLEAEAGTRTLVTTHGRGGAGCWDWAEMAPCTGGGYDDAGWLAQDVDGKPLPMGYGIAWDGSCAVGLGDPGLIYTVDPNGTAPCTSLGTGTAPRSLDLRSQRCDGTVGDATWGAVTLLDTPAGAAAAELSSLVVTVRDQSTGEVLLRRELIGGTTPGTLDLSGIDAGEHPALTLDATAVSKAGDPAWQDGIPPRLKLSWNSDPQQLCFETTVPVECSAALAPIGVTASVAGSGATATRELETLRSEGCAAPPVTGPQPSPTPLPTPAPAPPPPPPPPPVNDVADLLLGCTDRRVVLEDVVRKGRRVELIGVADRQFAGRKAEIVYQGSGKVVATAVIAPDGSFHATAPLPPRKQRKGNTARYMARVGGQRSLNLKLTRRMVVTSVSVSGGLVTISGRVAPPLARRSRDRAIEVRRRLTCSDDQVVARIKPRANGSFRASFPVPAGADGAVYRFKTRVRINRRSKRTTSTFTLPRIVRFR